MVGRPEPNFSFSGLKTAVRLAVENAPKPLDRVFVANMSASLQSTIALILADRTAQAFDMLEEEGKHVTALVVGGGVAANGAIRQTLVHTAQKFGVPFVCSACSSLY